MCEHYDYLGSRRDGGFSEYVVVPIWNLIPLPNNVSFVSAAMLEPLSVALHAIKIGGVKPGDRVAIIGTGMIGICAAQWAAKFGAESVIVIGRSEAKRKMVENCGVEYQTFSDIKDNSQWNFLLEAVGTPESIKNAISLVSPGGTVLLMGNPSGDIMFQQDVYWRILRKQLTIKGTWNSSYDGMYPSDWTEAVNAISRGEIRVDSLVTHQYKQENLQDGLKLMYEHQEPYCKVMTLWNEYNI